jgi:NADH-quinone oxidoreductase subunit N
MPLFAGFFTKFILFQAVANEGFLWRSVIAVVMSFVSLYYYRRVMKEMYISQPEEPGRFSVPLVTQGLVVTLVVGVFYVGIYPRHLLDAANEAAKLLFA